ncbi:MAG TPA: periplasmic heavy metal sensor, partial [Pyrinomonadaceae bacterium]|nr:periplasmic heavy metal sensor [Pyrinomonadaceae bacterium]
MKSYNGQPLFLIAALVFLTAGPSIGQTLRPQETPSPALQQRRLAGDPIQQLNLTPEQREQIRTIRQENQKERAAMGERVRETNRALELVLESDNPDEAVVEQRMRESSAAQAAAMRMRILTEVRIRRVLTDEQRTLLRTLRQQVNQRRRERPLDGPENRIRRRQDQRSLQGDRSRIGPLFPRRDLQKRT